ncbi:MAG: hypothetical protein U0167_14850 [bacterium]
MKPPIRRGRSALEAVALVALTLVIYRDAPRWGIQRAWDDGLVLLGRPEAVHWLAASWRDRLLTPKMGYPTSLPTLLQFLAMRSPHGAAVAHVLSLLVHVVNVLLARALVEKWTKRRALALATAAIWAAHPLLVESVAWLTDLKRLLASTFVLAGAIGWERFLERGRTRDAILVGLAQALGLACHPLAAALAPFAALRTLVRSPASLRTRSVLGALAGLGVLIALYVPLGVRPYAGFLAEANDPAVVAAAREQRFTLAATALALQTKHAVWPASLHPAYTAHYPGSDADRVLGAALAAALVAATAWAVRKGHHAREGLLFAWVFYLPSSGLTVTPRFLADSFAYLPTLGFLAAAATALPLRRRSPLRPLLAGGLVLALAWQAHRQAARWENALTLWEPLMDAAPNYARSYEIVGEEYAARGDWAHAASVYDRGYRALRTTGSLTTRMAAVYRRAGDPVKAADVAMVVFEESRGADGEAARFLVETLAEERLALPPSERARAIVRSAAEASAAPGRFDDAARRRIAEYFRGQGAPETAQLFEGAASPR